MHIDLREISVEEFDEMIENHDELLVVDVRDDDAFHRGHIPGAIRLPRALIDPAADDGAGEFLWARPKTLVLCSQDGSRCAAPASRLHSLGFEKVYSLAGGIDRWLAQGYALATD